MSPISPRPAAPRRTEICMWPPTWASLPRMFISSALRRDWRRWCAAASTGRRWPSSCGCVPISESFWDRRWATQRSKASRRIRVAQGRAGGSILRRLMASKLGDACHATASRPGSVCPITQRFNVRRRAIAEPTVELCRLLELLSTLPRHGDKPARQLRQAGHVAPELFKLRHRENVFLAFSPALFHLLQGDVGGHTGGQVADPGV